MTGPKRWHRLSASALRSRRASLVHRLPPLHEVLRGSLIERYKRCGKPGCRCAEGPGHGPKFYLSVSRSGERPLMEYVPTARYGEVSGWVENHRSLRELLEEICEINLELLRRREALE